MFEIRHLSDCSSEIRSKISVPVGLFFISGSCWLSLVFVVLLNPCLSNCLGSPFES